MLKFVPDYFKIKNGCKNEIKKLPCIITHVPDRSKSQEMCDKVILENGEILRFIPDCYQNLKSVLKSC